MRFPICFERVFPSLDMQTRMARISGQGFHYVDFWDWHTKDIDELRNALNFSGMKLNCFNGNHNTSPAMLGQRADFLEEIRNSISLAHRLDCAKLVVLSDGITSINQGKENPSTDEKRSHLVRALGEAAEIAEKEDMTLCLEALNLTDHPGYFLSKSEPTLEIVRTVGNPHLKMLYDIYHMQISEGNITNTLLKNLEQIGYIHFADVPGRHEPGTGELNLPFILSRLKSVGFKDFVGFEFSPKGDDELALIAIRNQTKDFTE